MREKDKEREREKEKESERDREREGERSHPFLSGSNVETLTGCSWSFFPNFRLSKFPSPFKIAKLFR